MNDTCENIEETEDIKLLSFANKELNDKIEEEKGKVERLNLKIERLTLDYEYLDQKYDKVFSILTEGQKQILDVSP